jgi:hypothetical protein
MTKTTTHRFPCLDHFPAGKNFVSDKMLEQAAQQQVSENLKSGSSPSKADEKQAFTKLKASFKVSSIWDPKIYPRIRIAFLDGTPKQKKWVEKVVKQHLAPLCNKLEFVWNVPAPESDIRISFSLPGQAWSYIGNECKQIPVNQMTMNLGWIDDDVQYDSEAYKNTGQVVLHEFCHALGMIHEHQNPKGNTIKWNKDVVYAELARTNGWDADQVNHNMFKRYGDKDMCEKVKNMPAYDGQRMDIKDYCEGDQVNGSEYDVHSIMHYFYPASWILEGPTEIPVNTKLSELDKKWLQKYYGRNPPSGNIKTDDVSSSETTDTDTILLIMIYVCLVSYLALYYFV